MNNFIKISSVVILTLILSIGLTNTSSSAQNSLQSTIGITQRVSVDSDGTQGNNGSDGNFISANGRYVTFVSSASNLVLGDTNNYCDTNYDGNANDNCPDVFVNDRLTGETVLVSIASDGTQGNNWSGGYGEISISADGRFIAFESRANNLVTVDANGYQEDIFVHDLQTGETALVSISSDGTQSVGSSSSPAINADGRYVAFQSNQLTEDDQSPWSDVFVHDRQTGETTLVSVSTDGEQGYNDSGYINSISGDGRYVGFLSNAPNLVGPPYIYGVDAYIHDRQTGVTSLVAITSDGTRGDRTASWPSFSYDGRYIAFASNSTNLVPGDTNGVEDVFVRDQLTGEVTIASLSSAGMQANGWYYGVSISADGNYVTFSSTAEDLVPNDNNGNIDIFLHSMLSGETSLVSIGNDGSQANWHSWYPTITADGRNIAFDSWASNLVPDDTNNFCDSDYDGNANNNCPDVFVRDTEAVGIHTISGRVTDSDSLPIAGVTVSAGSWYSAITDAQGYYNIGEVYTGTYTLIPSMGDNLFTPLFRRVTFPPNAEHQDFTLEIPLADLHFRPNTDGYHFSNGLASGAGNFSVADIRRMFGDQAVCSPFALSCKINMQSWLWRTYALQVISAGQSDAMAATALRFFKEFDTHPGIDTTFGLAPADDVRINWNSESFTTTLLNDITFFSSEQLLDPVKEEKYQSLQDTPTQVLAKVIAALSVDASDPVSLFIRPGTGRNGHTLVPYAVTDHGDGTNWIWVYDSEHPFANLNPVDASRYVIINLTNDTWTYDLGDRVWSGDAASHTLGIVPLSLYGDQPDCPWCVTPIPNAEVWLSGGGHLLISDSQGRRLGYIGNDYVSEIPVAYGGFIDASTQASLEPIYTLPLTDTYSILLNGQTLTQTSSASLAQFGPGYAVQVGNISVIPTTSDQVVIANDGSRMGYHASQNQELNLTMAMDSTSTNYALSILGADIASGEAITLSVDIAAGELILDGSISSGGIYALSIRMITSDGMSKFMHAAIPLLATDTHIIHFGDWNGSGVILLEIDHDSDGITDEIIQLENQLISFFLPLVTTHE